MKYLCLIIRVSPSLPTLQKMKASIDACVSKRTLLKKYKDPHLYSSVIKHFLRELPDPLLCSAFLNDWKTIDQLQDQNEKLMEIKKILERIPSANKNNITFLFGFLEKIEKEKMFNKMTVENIIVVLSPNLLWDSNGVHVPISSVYKAMLENYEFIFENTDFDHYDEIDNFEVTAPGLTRKVEQDVCYDDITKRSSTARAAIRENRRRYQTRSSSDSFMLRSSHDDNSEYLNLIKQADDQKIQVLPARRTLRKLSRSLTEESSKMRMSFVRTYSAMEPLAPDKKERHYQYPNKNENNNKCLTGSEYEEYTSSSNLK